MKNTPLIQPQPLQDEFGRRLARRLSSGTAELPYSTTERLRAARVQAVAKRKSEGLVTASSVQAAGRAATLSFGEQGVSLWNRIASALPLIALAVGLILIHAVQNDSRASEVAEVDAALLTDALPPAAYADPGFLQFLMNSRD